MRIKAITNWAYGATLLLTGISGTAFILASSAAADERRAIEHRLTLDTLSEELALAAEQRSDEARLFAMRGAQRHLIAFVRDEREIDDRRHAIGRLRGAGLVAAESAALEAAERNIDELDQIERAAIAKVRGGDVAAGRQMLFGADHERAQTAVLEPVQRFRELVAARTSANLRHAQMVSDTLNGIAKASLGLTALLFLGVLYFVLRRRVVLPLTGMTKVVMRLARQDYSVEVPADSRQDEIGDMNQAIHVFRDNGLERDRLEAERAAEQRIKDAILKMMHRLQAAATQQELAEVVACFVPQTFPMVAGHLYVLDGPGAALTLAGSWLDPENTAVSLAANACWGVRRGRPHVSNQSVSDIPCSHVEGVSAPSICVPLTAQGDTVGVLYLEEQPGSAPLNATARVYLELMAENIGLALANIRLREQLTGMALRDGLTGLLNRRCLDEAVNRHARDESNPMLACLMIDIDHFKRFNDQHGHDAGDVVMQHVAQIMSSMVDEPGRVYRFGGEEFTILLPGSSQADAVLLADALRAQIEATPLAHRGRVLGHVSVSIGVATTLQSGSVRSLVPCADAALLEAKTSGRNQVVVRGQAQAASAKLAGAQR